MPKQKKKECVTDHVSFDMSPFHKLFAIQSKKFWDDYDERVKDRIERMFTERMVESQLEGAARKAVKEAARKAVEEAVGVEEIKKMVEGVVALSPLRGSKENVLEFVKQLNTFRDKVYSHPKVQAYDVTEDLEFDENGATINVWDEDSDGDTYNSKNFAFTWDELLGV